YFYENWRQTLAAVGAARPDLVVVSGDLSINGSDDDDDIAFARRELERLPRPWLALPGNHDVGEEPGGVLLGQPVDDRRVGRYLASFVADRWTFDRPGWRLVGIDSQLLGSGLPAEREQDAFLVEALRTAGDCSIGVITHKPLFLEDPGEEPESEY